MEAGALKCPALRGSSLCPNFGRRLSSAERSPRVRDSSRLVTNKQLFVCLFFLKKILCSHVNFCNVFLKCTLRKILSHTIVYLGLVWFKCYSLCSEKSSFFMKCCFPLKQRILCLIPKWPFWLFSMFTICSPCNVVFYLKVELFLSGFFRSKIWKFICFS